MSVMNIILFGNGKRSIEVYKDLKKRNFNLKAFIIIKKNYDYFTEFVPSNLLLCLDDINSNYSIEQVHKLNPDLLIVAGFSQILKKDLLKIPNIGTINLHAGKLPEYRGGSPLNWQLINKEKKAGISIILMDEGIDTGNILAESEFKIQKEDDIKSLHNKANKKFPDLVNTAIQKLIEGDKGLIQDENLATYWHQRQDKDGELNFRDSYAIDIHHKIKALCPPYKGAWASLEDKKIIFLKSVIPNFKIKGTPGKVLFIQSNGPYIICKDFAILIKEYTLETNPDFKLSNNMYF